MLGCIEFIIKIKIYYYQLTTRWKSPWDMVPGGRKPTFTIRNEIISYLKKALFIYPDFESAKSFLGIIFLRNSLFDSSEKYLHEAYINKINDISIIKNLAEVYYKQNKFCIILVFF